MERSVFNPLFPWSSKPNSFNDVTNSFDFVYLSVSRSYSCGLFPFLLNRKSVFKILILILKIFCHYSELGHLLLITSPLPLVKSLGKTLFMQVDETKLKPIHVVLVVSTVVSPFFEGLVHHVLVLLNKESEELGSIFLD
jgi:hypothetical protein